MGRLRRRRDCRAIVVSGTLIVALAGCGEDAPPPDLPPRAIQWMGVSASGGGERRVVSGIVTAIDVTRLGFEVNGTVQTVEVDLGYRVEKGQVLARLDPQPLRLSVQDAEAALAESTALMEEARSSAARFEQAGKTGAVARQEVERELARRDARESQVEAARARLALARRDLRLSVLEAPFRGTISSRMIDPAQRIAAGETAFEMDSEESGLRVEVQIPETLISRVRQGDPVQVSFPSLGYPSVGFGDRRWEAVVSEIGTRAGTGNAFPVRADLVDPPDGVRPGMTAEATFSLARDDGLRETGGVMIPFAAARPEADDRFSVFVFDSETSTVKKRPIRTGGVHGNEIFVLEGLEDGEIIATAGVTFLRDGQQVTLLDEELIRRSQ
jgi:RND family efflux transporter MFP subunit